MKKNFSHGSAESMKAAFESRLAELDGTAVESSMYVDTQGMFGEVDGVVTEDEARDYWDNNQEDDPSLSEYSTFEDWWNDTQPWLDPVDASTEAIEADHYVGVESGDASSSYIEDLINECNSELESEDFFDAITWEETDEALELTCIEGDRVLEYMIPKEDLDMDDIEMDRDYICNTVRADINGDYYEDEE